MLLQKICKGKICACRPVSEQHTGNSKFDISVFQNSTVSALQEDFFKLKLHAKKIEKL